ncbi:MAG: hypothetical protein HYV95_16205 [Opitutae bacterium]|nr:hypothetical protein [Opitutae bacterium]
MNAILTARTENPALSTQPLPALATYATAHNIPLEGVTLAARSEPHPGDEVRYLLELTQPAGRQQWLVRFIADKPDKARGEPKPLPDDIFRSNSGHARRIHHTPTMLALEFIGPFTAGEESTTGVTTRYGRATVSAESLEAGLMRYSEWARAIAARLKAAAASGARPAETPLQLSPEEEHLLLSVIFSLRAFYEAASGIPACRDVLDQVLQKPSLWSVASNRGVNVGFNYDWNAVGMLPDGTLGLATRVHEFPMKMSLNGRPALDMTLTVTETRPPLRSCAGLVSLTAQHPTDKAKFLYLRLLSARPAPPAR